MKRLSKLTRLNRYLLTFEIPDYPDITPIRVVNAGDATSRLGKVSGDQVLIALPELDQDCEGDLWRDRLTLGFYAIAKIGGPAWTQERADRTFERMADIVDSILSKIAADMTGRSCQGLAGLSLESVSVLPEDSVFGGWSGYSIEMILS